MFLLWIRLAPDEHNPVDWLIQRYLYYPDGTPRRGPNSPASKNRRDDLHDMVQALLHQYNDYLKLSEVLPLSFHPHMPVRVGQLLIYAMCFLSSWFRILHMNLKIFWAMNGFLRKGQFTIISTSQPRRKRLTKSTYSSLKCHNLKETGLWHVAALLDLLIMVSHALISFSVLMVPVFLQFFDLPFATLNKKVSEMYILWQNVMIRILDFAKPL